MPEGESAFVADAALRLDAPPRARDRSRLIIAALAAALIEAAVFAVIWRERAYAPPPPLEEIPVEVVVETPPPAPPPSPTPEASPTPEPTPSPEMKTQEYEKPATDAPREGKSDHDDDTVGPKDKPAAPLPTPTASPEPAKPAETASPEPSPQPTTPAETAAPEPTPSPEDTKPPQTPAPELPKAAEAEAPPPAEPSAPKPPETPKPTAVAGLPKAFANVPDVDFGGAAIKSDVTGGNARATYFSRLFGIIVPRFRIPPLARAYGRVLHGVALFEVDGRGRLTQRGIQERSGSLELDEAAMEALAAASRFFPAPPQRAPMVIEWHYNSDE